MNLKKISGNLPAVFPSLWEEMKEYGFVPTLVGGVVRDFCQSGKLGEDWDIEVTHSTIPFNKDHWKSFGKKISKYGRTVFLPYEVIRLEVSGFQFEFSPPRVEDFFHSESHKNFTATFDFKLPFEKAVLRRDFTVNAMGIRFHSLNDLEFLDPLHGGGHLKEKLLHYCGPDFAKDPVRFLRAYRMSLSMGMAFSDELKKILTSMKISGISPGYLWSEMQKSKKPLEFYRILLTTSEDHQEFNYPTDPRETLNKMADLKRMLVDPSQHESWMIALEWVGLSSSSWSQYFNLSSETGRKLGRWAESSREFISIMPETFHGEFEEILKEEKFQKLFDWYFTTKQLLQKNQELPLLSMIEEYLPDWIHLFRFEAVKDVRHIEPPLRAKYQVWNLCQRL